MTQIVLTSFQVLNFARTSGDKQIPFEILKRTAQYEVRLSKAFILCRTRLFTPGHSEEEVEADCSVVRFGSALSVDQSSLQSYMRRNYLMARK
jgi:hypothetical protein